MRGGKLLVNGLVMAAAAWMFVHGTKTGAAGLLPAKARAPIATETALTALETRAALSPDADSIGKLASAYLDRDQPGLASAVLQSAPPAVQATPEIAHLQARALLHRGKVPEALAMARRVEAACEAGMAPDGARNVCPPWLLARSARQLAFLEEMGSAGIEDPALDPEAARAAYDRSSREVRFVAMR